MNDLKKMSDKELALLAENVRHKILTSVSKNGGHLSSNLGVVELTIALHKTFDLPKDYKLPDWIMENCKKHFNKNIDRNACAYIAEAIGNDTWKIMSELKNILFLNPNIPSFSENIVKSFIVPTRKMQAFEINKFLINFILLQKFLFFEN